MTDVLRIAIQESGKSFLALEKETGVTRQTLMGFARGQRTIHLTMADKLAAYFGLELTAKPKKG